MSGKKIRIELGAARYRVNGRPARYQSLWLLLRLYYGEQSCGGPVHVSAILARFPGASSLRMRISRAYADFADWGISAGWGRDTDKAPALLNRARRSQGPFWLAAGQARRLDIRLDGRYVELAELAGFLGAASLLDSQEASLEYVMHDVRYWSELTQALRMAKDGIAASTEHGVAEHFGRAQAAAKDEFQASLSLLKESLIWRRHGHVRRSEDALLRLRPYLASRGDYAALPSFSAMAAIAHAWNLYAQGNVPAAQGALAQVESDLVLQPVIRYNPRVRFEFLNLRALLGKSVAMALQTIPLMERIESAMRAMQDLSGALQAAYEADSIEAAQDVAANIGWSLWLFWTNGLIDQKHPEQEDVLRMQAIRWIGLSEWVCDRFGVGGGSAWNTIFLLRIVRGGCNVKGPVTLSQFQAQRPVSVRQVLDATNPYHAPFSPAKGYVSWFEVARFTLEEHDSGHAQYGPLQLANVLLEMAWFSAHEHGLCVQAYNAAERLAAMLPALQPNERRFFREGLRDLPLELAAAATDTPASATERRRTHVGNTHHARQRDALP